MELIGELPHPSPLVKRLLDHADTWDTSVRSGETAVGATWQTPAPRLLDERLSDADVQKVIKMFRAGTPKHRLAEEYGISVSSVKRVLARHGVKKEAGYPFNKS